MVAVLGKNDEYLHGMQKVLACQLIPRGNEIIAQGDAKSVADAENLLGELLYLYRQGLPITEYDVKYSLKLVLEGQQEQLHHMFTDTVLTTAQGKQVKAKTLGQMQYLHTINQNAITIAIGPAGTGKTYLAVAMAVKALKIKMWSGLFLPALRWRREKNWAFCQVTCRKKWIPISDPCMMPCMKCWVWIAFKKISSGELLKSHRWLICGDAH